MAAEGSTKTDEGARLFWPNTVSHLDSAPEERFERITRLACLALQAEAAVISLVEDGRLVLKAVQGLGPQEIPELCAFFAHALGAPGPTIVLDTHADRRFNELPLATGSSPLRFYAAYPLYAAGGQRIGDLSVLARAPRERGLELSLTLADLARLVETEVQLNALSRSQSELSHHLETARHQALRDDLTQIWNRAGILEFLGREDARARRQQLGLGVALVDLDHFKRVNDQHGHLAGDRVLRTAAQRMVEAVRPYDAVGRYGGDEFLIVIVANDLTAISHIAERIRRHIERLPIGIAPTAFPITASVGVAYTTPQLGSDSDALVQAADAAMYSAKHSGRNRVVIAEACERGSP
jgi:diguanylate cyclase (GGDEF)-like protein